MANKPQEKHSKSKVITAMNKALYDLDDENTQVFYFKNAKAVFSSFTKPEETVEF